MILTEHGDIGAKSTPPPVIRRDTNTIVIPLEQDEVLKLIAELADESALGGPVYLRIEQDEITYPREIV